MNVVARHVAFVMSGLTEEEAASLPWHRVVSSDARVSQSMPPEVARLQSKGLKAAGMKVNTQGFIQNADAHYHYPGPRRSIRWSHGQM